MNFQRRNEDPEGIMAFLNLARCGFWLFPADIMSSQRDSSRESHILIPFDSSRIFMPQHYWIIQIMTVTRHTNPKTELVWNGPRRSVAPLAGRLRRFLSPETLNSTYNWKMAWTCSLFSAQAFLCKVMSALRHWACHY